MSPSEKDRAIIEATLPGNTSLTHFTDFRSSHEDLARLLSAVRQEAYKEGWNDREDDLIAGVNRIMPEEASQGAGEPAKGWLYHCPDTGTEWSDNHPLESGEVSDAEDVRPATLDALHAELMAAWEVLAERISPPNPQAGEPVADPFAGQLAEAQADPEWLAKWAISPPPDPRTKALEEAVNKAIRILSDHKLGEPRRVLDARDVLIIARAALNQGADHD